MTITQNVASKLIVGFVAASLVFSLSFAPAKAQTIDELKAEIAKLTAMIQALSGAGGATTPMVTPGGVCPFTWTMDLRTGSTGPEVKKLQQFLNSDAETRVAASGPGSVGSETTTFGPMTAAAVSKFQTKYRAEVLTPGGLVNPTGTFGPSSRAQANKLCAMTVPATPTTPTTPSTTTPSTPSVTLKGEASLDSFEVKTGEDTDIEEGQEDMPVAELEIEFDDGDARISRIDLALVPSGTEEDVWKTFEEVALYVDNKEVARKSLDSKSDYLDEDDGTFRISGLDIVAMEDKKLTIEVRVSTQNSIDDVPATWRLDADAVRFFDASDVSTTEDNVGDLGQSGASFDIDEAGGEDELIVKSSNTDPDATTLKLEDNNRSDWLKVFVFDLDTDDSTNDIQINELPISLTFSSSTAGTFVNDVRLKVGSETYDDFTAGTDAATRNYTFDFDEDEFVIEAGERVPVTVEVEFKQLALGNEGVTVSAAATSSDDIDAEGADTLGATQLSGSATGKTHTMRTTGVTISDFAWAVGSKGTLIDFTFKIKADDGEFTINQNTSFATSTAGSATTSNGVLTVLGDDDDVTGSGPSFTVEEGGEATFRLRFTVSGTDGQTSEVEVTTVAGQEVPSAKQTSPTATLDIN